MLDTQTKLNEAVEAKLTEQRKFGLWWDEQGKQADFLDAGRDVCSVTQSGPKDECQKLSKQITGVMSRRAR